MPERKNTIKSAKDILFGHDFLEQRAKAERYVHHEFQDYAYRLASQLGDLAHKPLYMRLAKSVPRHILEQALTFAADYKEFNKGRLFMWKLKQIRQSQQLEKDNQNFDFEFIVKRMGLLQDKYAENLFVKLRREKDSVEQQNLLNDVVVKLKDVTSEPRKKPQMVIFDTQAGFIADMFTSLGFKVTAMESSKIITAKIKKHYPSLNIKKASTQLPKDAKVHLIWIGDFWKFVSLGSEQKFLHNCQECLLPRGIIVLRYNPDEKDSEVWEEFTNGKEPDFRYRKVEPLSRLKGMMSESMSVQEYPGNYVVSIKN